MTHDTLSIALTRKNGYTTVELKYWNPFLKELYFEAIFIDPFTFVGEKNFDSVCLILDSGFRFLGLLFLL